MSAQEKQDSIAPYFYLEDAVNGLPIGGARATIMDGQGNVLADSIHNRIDEPEPWENRQFGQAIYYHEFIPRLPEYNLLITCAGYEPLQVNIDMTEKNFRWGTIKMTREARRLKEVTVTATKVKMVMKGDTLVYDATAFNLPQGSMLDDLIRNLPGAQLDRDGCITVNGKPVQSLLVNGREFFKGDPWVALKNLPYYTVKDVKVYHQAPERFQLSKRERSTEERENDPLVMDVNLKPQYIGGWLANAEAGLGSSTRDKASERWLGRIFGMHYTKKKTIAMYAQANNLNDGERAGTRGQWAKPTLSGGNETYKLAGIQYNADWADQERNGVDLVAHLKRSTSLSETSTVREEFMTGGNSYSKYLGTDNRRNWTLFTRGQISRRFSPGRVQFEASYDFRHENDFDNSDERQSSLSSENLFANPNSTEWEQSLLYQRTTVRSGRSSDHSFRTALKLEPNIETAKWISDLWLKAGYRWDRRTSASDFTDILSYTLNSEQGYDAEKKDDGGNGGWSYDVKAKFATSDFKSGRSGWKFSLDYGFKQSYGHNSFFRLEREIDSHEVMPSATEYGPWSEDLHNNYRRYHWDKEHTLHPAANYAYRTMRFGVGSDISFLDLRIDDRRSALDQSVSRDFVTWAPKFDFSVGKHDKRLSIYLSMDQRLPSMSEFLEIRNTNNPLYITETNPNLKRATTYRASIGGNLKNVGISLGYSKTDNSLASARTYNRTTGVYTSRKENVNGNWDASGSLSYNLYFKKINLSWNNSINARWSHNVDFSSDSDIPHLMAVNNQRATYNLSLQYNSKGWSIIGKSNIEWNRLENGQGVFPTMNYWDISYGVSLISPQLWGFNLETDLMAYCRRGYSDRTMNTTDWVWNLQLSRPFGSKKQFTVKAIANDLLQQFPNIRRYVNSMGRTETRHNTLPAYALLTLAYRLDLIPNPASTPSPL